MYSTSELCQLGECIMPVHVVMLVCVHRNARLYTSTVHGLLHTFMSE